MRLALVGGLLVGLTCAIAGTFVILRGLAFVGDALAHVAALVWRGLGAACAQLANTAPFARRV